MKLCAGSRVQVPTGTLTPRAAIVSKAAVMTVALLDGPGGNADVWRRGLRAAGRAPVRCGHVPSARTAAVRRPAVRGRDAVRVRRAGLLPAELVPHPRHGPVRPDLPLRLGHRRRTR